MNPPVTLLKTLEKKYIRKCQREDCRYLVVFLISRDKNFILLLACFGLIFTKSLTLLSLVFLSLYRLLFPVALEQNLILSQENLRIFYILNESISELKVNR